MILSIENWKVMITYLDAHQIDLIVRTMIDWHDDDEWCVFELQLNRYVADDQNETDQVN